MKNQLEPSKSQRKINQKGLTLLKTYEGCKLTPYLDQGGLITIGYGHTGPEVNWGMHLTVQGALDLLEKDLVHVENEVDSFLTIPVNDNEFSALVSFAYNEGTSKFRMSTLRSLINAGKKELAADEFLKWVYVHGLVSQGLMNRRLAERALFLEPV